MSMALNLRTRILATLLPLWLLLAVIGGAGMMLLLRLGGNIEVILKENYDSVLYMERLHEALERIDSSFQFALAGKAEKAKQQFDLYWPTFDKSLEDERKNITLPGEQELVNRLTKLSGLYKKRGIAFFAAFDVNDRTKLYFGDGKEETNLYRDFEQIKENAVEILRLNQANMEEASREAKATASVSAFWFGVGLVSSAWLAMLLAWHTVRTLVGPIRDLKSAAQGIAAGNLDQILPATTGDELGELSQAFTVMARRLRQFRQSETSRLLRAQLTSQATIDAFPEPVLVLNAQGAIEMANPAARRTLHVIPEADPSKEWAAPEALRQPIQDALTLRRDYLPEGFEGALHLGINGQTRTMLPRILAIRDAEGQALGAAVVMHDVTRMQVLDEVKSNLVATVSHELKTPLTGIRLAVHLLLEEAAGPLMPKQAELLIDARDHSERLLAMVENLLDLARFEQGRRQIEFRPMKPDDLLRESAEAMRSRAQDKGVAFTVEPAIGLPPVNVDPLRMRTAISNLLDNALAYTERGGSISLKAQRNDGAVELTVTDTGRGIPPDALPHVFEKFFRVPGQSRPGGTGLGLAIVHEIVAAHGGSIVCESTLGEGSAFRISLPVAEGNQP